VGRLDAPGRPILFGTTEEFLRCFSVASVTELPPLPQERIEEIREEAAREAGLPLEPARDRSADRRRQSRKSRRMMVRRKAPIHYRMQTAKKRFHRQ